MDDLPEDINNLMDVPDDESHEYKSDVMNDDTQEELALQSGVDFIIDEHDSHAYECDKMNEYIQRLFSSNPVTHVRQAKTLIKTKKWIWNPCSRVNEVVSSFEITKTLFLKHPLYFIMI